MIFSVYESSRLLHLNGIDKSGDFEAFWLGLYQAVLEVFLPNLLASLARPEA